MDQLRLAYERWVSLEQPTKVRTLKIIALVFYFLFVLLFVILAFGGTSTKTRDRRRVVVFMEAIPYNLAALKYVAHRRDVEIGMVVLTVNSWNRNLADAYANVASFVTLLQQEGLSQPFPVYYGSSVAEVNSPFFDQFRVDLEIPVNTTSCTYSRVMSDVFHAEADRLFGAASSLYRGVQFTAPQEYIYYDEPLQAYLAHGSATFLVLGPSTDASLFLQHNIESRDKVTHIVVSGGAFSVKGDASEVYPPNEKGERHFFFDPKAAHYLVGGRHGRPVTVVPLDATVLWDPGAYETLVKRFAQGSVSGITTDRVVAEGIMGFHKIVVTNAYRVSVAMIATLYAMDADIQDSARVTNFYVSVTNGDSMKTDGTSFSTAASHSPIRSARVVLKLEEEKLWSNWANVVRLPLA